MPEANRSPLTSRDAFVISVPVVIWLLLVVAIPLFHEIFEAMGGALPPQTRLVIKASALAIRFWPLSALLAIALWFTAFRYLLHGRSPSGRRMVWITCGAMWIIVFPLFVWALYSPVFRFLRSSGHG